MSEKKANPIDVQIGARMRARRLSLGITQQELAAKIGVTFQQLQKYEKGENRVGASRIQMVAHGLGVSPAYFFGDVAASAVPSADGETTSLSEFLLTKQGLELNSAFLKIPNPRIRRSLVAMVKVIASMEAQESDASSASEFD